MRVVFDNPDIGEERSSVSKEMILVFKDTAELKKIAKLLSDMSDDVEGMRALAFFPDTYTAEQGESALQAALEYCKDKEI